MLPTIYDTCKPFVDVAYHLYLLQILCRCYLQFVATPYFLQNLNLVVTSLLLCCYGNYHHLLEGLFCKLKQGVDVI
jgi:hypothetical protein